MEWAAASSFIDAAPTRAGFSMPYSKIGRSMLRIKEHHFIDEEGRVVHLRGVNLGGSSKVPNSGQSAAGISFVGRPFPLAEADEHFGRLRAWGLTFIRLLVTWEAIEHGGPGVYDEAYLDYLHALMKKAGDYDLLLFIDPHQDVWSRHSGGDGAPGWTFELLGMDPAKFHLTGAAFTHQGHGDPLPRMMWPSNYGKYACATLFTLFFGGNTFAPYTRIEGERAQDFLQGHYIAAVKQVARRMQEFPHVLGYDTLNEPSPGMIGCADLNQVGVRLASYGALPTYYQGMLLAAGFSQEVHYQARQFLPLTRKIQMNAARVSLWRPGCEPVWKQHGVWGVGKDGKPRLLKPDYFASVEGRPVNFAQDFLAPFVERFIREVREEHPGAIIFVSPTPVELRSGPEGLRLNPEERIANAPHWYDGITLASQHYLPWLGIDAGEMPPRVVLGRKNRRRLFMERVRRLVQSTREQFGEAPLVIGEAGIPLNLAGGKAYRTGDFSKQILALDDALQALEANIVNFTLWNYTADNTNSGGDAWNGEDFSLFSRDQQAGNGSLYAGGRALEAVLRPYVRCTPGMPLRMSFDWKAKIFEFEFEHDPSIQAPLEVFVPRLHYPNGVRVTAGGGTWKLDLERQRLEYSPGVDGGLHIVRLAPR